MTNRSTGLTIVLSITLWVPTAVNATLYDRGNGLFYDSDQDITWLQNANYAKTSGYTETETYRTDGRMSWYEATAWTEGLENMVVMKTGACRVL